MIYQNLKYALVMRVALAVLYLLAGIAHLAMPDSLLPIMPGWVPMPREVVIVTGLCEIAGALALFIPPLRKAAGAALTLYAICVFPANIKHAIEGIDAFGFHATWVYHGPRLLAQPVIVWWSLACTGWTRWPFGKAPQSAD